jgi:hypothetical protein
VEVVVGGEEAMAAAKLLLLLLRLEARWRRRALLLRTKRSRAVAEEVAVAVAVEGEVARAAAAGAVGVLEVAVLHKESLTRRPSNAAGAEVGEGRAAAGVEAVAAAAVEAAVEAAAEVEKAECAARSEHNSSHLEATLCFSLWSGSVRSACFSAPLNEARDTTHIYTRA